jgi:hypothetical protein
LVFSYLGSARGRNDREQETGDLGQQLRAMDKDVVWQDVPAVKVLNPSLAR